MLFVVSVLLSLAGSAAWAWYSGWRSLASKYNIMKCDDELGLRVLIVRKSSKAEWEEAPCLFSLNGYPYSLCLARLGASRDGLHLTGPGGAILGSVFSHPAITVPWRNVTFKGETPDLYYYEVDLDGTLLRLRNAKLYGRLMNTRKISDIVKFTPSFA
eukprot:jgi/Bigna1/66207/fgenesh1_pg.1_\